MKRRMMWLAGLTLGAILLLGAGSAGAAVQPNNAKMYDLGTLTGGSSSEARAVNNSSVVAGGAKDSSGTNVAMKDDGTMQSLGTLDNQNYYTVARGINDSNQIVGSSIVVNTYGSTQYKQDLAFLYANGSMTSLGTLPDSTFSIAYGINNPSGTNSTGTVVGVSGTTSSFQAFYTDANGMEGLGSQLGRSFSIAYGINDSGDIVGTASTANPLADLTLIANGTITISDLNSLNAEAFTADGTSVKYLGFLSGGNFSLARAINDKGQIVGYSTTSDGQIHAFLYQDGTMTDLGSLGGGYSLAYGINDQGQIVGASTTKDGVMHAFIYQDGQMYDLGVLAGGISSSARGINDLGQVVGVSKVDGYDHAFITDPISPAPLPGAALLFGAGLIRLAFFGRKKMVAAKG